VNPEGQDDSSANLAQVKLPEAQVYVPPLVRLPLPVLFRHREYLTLALVQNRTETLEVGSKAPNFSLTAANCEGIFSLAEMLKAGPVLVEFLRGTW
jgi:hypothetical protein